MRATWAMTMVAILALAPIDLAEGSAEPAPQPPAAAPSIAGLPEFSTAAPLQGIVAIAAGWYHTCALTSGGGVKC